MPDPVLYPNGLTSGPHMIPPYTLLGGPENLKLLFDSIMQISQQGILDNQANSRAYAAINLRRAENAATADHLANMNVVIAAQVGDASGQQTTSPIRTGAGDNLAAGAAPTDRVTDTAGNAVAAGIAESVQTNVTTQVSALSLQITALGGTITTALQAVSDSNASIAASLATMAAALTALAPASAAPPAATK
jgi:hypothetical protein